MIWLIGFVMILMMVLVFNAGAHSKEVPNGTLVANDNNNSMSH